MLKLSAIVSIYDVEILCKRMHRKYVKSNI